MFGRYKEFFFLLLGALVVWFLYSQRAILTPIVLAGVFAYLLNPVVNFVSKKTKLPRSVTVLIIYALVIGLFIFGILRLSMQVFEEFTDLRIFATNTLKHTQTQLAALPDWARPTARQLLVELERSRFVTFFNSPSLFPFVSQAFSRIVSFFIFLFSGFYFLKDGGKMSSSFINLFSEKDKKSVEDLFKNINVVLSRYLRGQIFLILLMGFVTYIALAIIGVQFAAIIAVFSGFAEIVPVIGPITAGAVAASAVLVTGHAHFGLTPLNGALVVVVVYFILRQLEDYFVIPYVMGNITKLPPYVIFFAVIIGGNLWGILGLILAVPVAGILRLLIEFSAHHLHKKMVQGSE